MFASIQAVGKDFLGLTFDEAYIHVVLAGHPECFPIDTDP